MTHEVHSIPAKNIMTTPSNPETTGGFSRRKFIKSQLALALAARAFPAIIPASALGRDGHVAPSNRIALGIIGCGPQGMGVLSGFLNEDDCHVSAACDLKPDRLKLAADTINGRYQNQDCRTYQDFSELVARDDMDAFLIATPDHWHVLPAIAAVNAGKDVYVEKPLALGLAERQAMRNAVEKNGRMFQFGTQQRSSRNFRHACELVRKGHIGKLQHINIWAPGSAPGGSRKVTPPPAGMDFDRWLGPAPLREHTENLCTDDSFIKTWWFVSDFALGFIAGWGIHPLDIAVWGAEDRLGDSVEVKGSGVFRNDEGICDTATVWEVDFTFASGLTMKFVGVPNGGNQFLATGDPFAHGEEWTQRYGKIDSHGTAFEGSDGWVHVDRSRVNPQNKELARLDLATSGPNHARNFLDSVKSRVQPVCPIDSTVLVDNLCHAADIAIRLKRPVKLDLKNEIFTDDAEAQRMFVGKPLRAPWKL